MRIIPEWRAYRRIVQPNAPVKAVNSMVRVGRNMRLLPTVPLCDDRDYFID